MKKFFILFLTITMFLFASCSSSLSSVPAEQSKKITDMMGRECKVPTTISRIYGADPTASLLIYTITPEKLVGWNYKFNDAEKAYILPGYRNLPVFGMSDAVNYEAILQASPEICLFYSTLDNSNLEAADALQDKLGIPVVMVDGNLENVGDVYRFMGELLGMGDVCTQHAEYANAVLKKIDDVDIAESNRVRLYYGNGKDSFETASKGSVASKTIDLAKVENVIISDQKSARITTSLEQIIFLNPDVMIINGEPKDNVSGRSAIKNILSNPNFAQIKAVKNGQVYAIPKVPFSWVDRPRGVNRVLGLVWLCETLYPNVFNYDIRIETKKFYELYYHIILTDTQLDEILIG